MSNTDELSLNLFWYSDYVLNHGDSDGWTSIIVTRISEQEVREKLVQYIMECDFTSRRNLLTNGYVDYHAFIESLSSVGYYDACGEFYPGDSAVINEYSIRDMLNDPNLFNSEQKEILKERKRNHEQEVAKQKREAAKKKKLVEDEAERALYEKLKVKFEDTSTHD